ncbi:iron export ABC transporter permease subunit FetB [Paenibacillus sp. JCM 10914]|uniref:ABC transporter permease n=1 Tax=Paenibacillus sp. JCM 10914 TaxID=1236974 RepID=UPI0003CC9F1B|nr:iron export ABC transporter permease subunit FetB [Paenibacillus sp. JCM 10914]GAE09175.1 YbbM seven transmembrane helix protein [Paenibacillus sp. JCM 10914]
MTLLALSFTLVFVLATMLVSVWQKLGLEKEIAVGTIRSAIQLLAIGYVLQYIFRTEQPSYLILMIMLMIGVAAWNAARRGPGMRGILWRIAAAILTTELLMMGILLGLGIIEPTPQYIIPLSGMTIGNAMVVSGLFVNQMRREVASSQGEIEVLLSLGATAAQSMQDVRKSAVKTVGLVQLPGMMTGMIVAGADPVEAVRYQILIVFSFTGSAAVTSMLLSILSYRLMLTKDLRLSRFCWISRS